MKADDPRNSRQRPFTLAMWDRWLRDRTPDEHDEKLLAGIEQLRERIPVVITKRPRAQGLPRRKVATRADVEATRKVQVEWWNELGARHRWNVSAMVAEAGVNRTHFYALTKRLGIALPKRGTKDRG